MPHFDGVLSCSYSAAPVDACWDLSSYCLALLIVLGQPRSLSPASVNRQITAHLYGHCRAVSIGGSNRKEKRFRRLLPLPLPIPLNRSLF